MTHANTGARAARVCDLVMRRIVAWQALGIREPYGHLGRTEVSLEKRRNGRAVRVCVFVSVKSCM